jgi:hypothetical protein
VILAEMTPTERQQAYAATSPTARTTSSASTTCATTWPGRSRSGAARPQLRDRRRGRLDPHRRGPDPADHLRPGRAELPLVPSSPRSPPGCAAARTARATTRSTRRSGPSASPSPASRRSRTGSASTTSTTRSTRRWSPSSTTRSRPRSCSSGQGLRRDERRGPDRRRVHRPHPARPPLQRGHAPGHRGQGRRADPGREPDARHDHPAELLPALRQARGHDRYGETEANEFMQIYKLGVVPIPTNKPMVRATRPT